MSDSHNAPPSPGHDPMAMRAVEGATVDAGRQIRCGFGEVIYGEGKDAELIIRIVRTLLESQSEVLVTRLADEMAAHVIEPFPYTRYHAAARTLRIGRSAAPLAPGPSTNGPPTSEPSPSEPASPPWVAVITAGSTDRPAAEEARETLAWMGISTDWIEDVGVAGPQRLLAAVPRLVTCRAIVVAAGMEGALPSVVAGHVACPVIALPTSAGYGASLGGITAMLGMLTSCAAGVAVVNIDAGFKAGYLAGMIATAGSVAENRATSTS